MTNNMSRKRLAYVLGARQKAGDTLNQQELDFLQEQEIERRVLDKLEKMVDTFDHNVPRRRHELLGEREAFAMIRFFYLVRIAQQGFLHLIANAYPTLESEAIIYLADKLVAGSMGGISTIHHECTYGELTKNEAKKTARAIVFKLYSEADEPVGDGFKTTYKEIMQIAHVIAGQGIYEHQKKADGTCSTALFQPSLASVPAVYVVFPQLSMAAPAAADPKLSGPAAAVENATLPLPGFLLSSKTGHVTLPPPKDLKEDTANSAWTAPDAIVDGENVNVEAPVSEHVPDQTAIENEDYADEPDADSSPEAEDQQAATTMNDTDRTARRKKSSKTKSKKSRRERLKRTESRAAADQEADDNANSIESHQQPPPQQQQEKEQEEEEEENEDDRFADADLLDDDAHEILQQGDDDDETDAAKDTTQKTKVQDNATPSTSRLDTPTTTTTTTTTTTSAPSPSQWQSFAANCNTDDSNTPLSSGSRSGNSSRMGRR
ncbi:unnamed protein product [Mucor fragilis]